MSASISGGCLCGAIRWDYAGKPLAGGHCHCLDCRKTSGSGHRSHMVADRAGFTLRGETSVYERPADSGNIVGRAFCPTCGAPVCSYNSGMPGFVFISASSLDDPEAFAPQMVVYDRSAPSWDRLDPDLPSFETSPPPTSVVENASS